MAYSNRIHAFSQPKNIIEKIAQPAVPLAPKQKDAYLTGSDVIDFALLHERSVNNVRRKPLMTNTVENADGATMPAQKKTKKIESSVGATLRDLDDIHGYSQGLITNVQRQIKAHDFTPRTRKQIIFIADKSIQSATRLESDQLIDQQIRRYYEHALELQKQGTGDQTDKQIIREVKTGVGEFNRLRACHDDMIANAEILKRNSLQHFLGFYPEEDLLKTPFRDLSSSIRIRLSGALDPKNHEECLALDSKTLEQCYNELEARYEQLDARESDLKTRYKELHDRKKELSARQNELEPHEYKSEARKLAVEAEKLNVAAEKSGSEGSKLDVYIGVGGPLRSAAVIHETQEMLQKAHEFTLSTYKLTRRIFELENSLGF